MSPGANVELSRTGLAGLRRRTTDPAPRSAARTSQLQGPPLPTDHGFPMPDSTTTRRSDRPTEGFHTARLSAHPDRPVRLFVPADYQPKYAYPLVVLFHAGGADEDAAARLAPSLSRRNYVTACPRGSVPLGPGATGRPGFAWDDADPHAADYL